MKGFYSLIILLMLSTFETHAGGVGLGTTRLIYSSDSKQSSLAVRNTDQQAQFLIQSWIEDERGQPSRDFVITPPLFVLKPDSENMLKVLFAGKPLAQDRETLYWITVKSIPQTQTGNGANTLQFASASRIKLFYRPHNIADEALQSYTKIKPSYLGQKITFSNPTPFYITTTNVRVDNKTLPPVMIPPQSEATIPGKFQSPQRISYQTINDYGALTPVVDVHF
ncbi:fimbria/pilus periplasmic chaperone [Enterobacter sp. CC120223-11]|uniref:fimbria/pilus periplasmic chaperone n=1 Tax=Enterobacter sp. CC120223-11 TaxID=1378073 RepID=UPI000BCDE2CF|nr:fimbria/pilus periplasmic chaperone [Enterobacter sp. CC120223-11]SNY61487.1 fimbrial chaperone protein [Enterobacter sp. CC120223-11]